MDWKLEGIYPRRLESFRLRTVFFLIWNGIAFFLAELVPLCDNQSRRTTSVVKGGSLHGIFCYIFYIKCRITVSLLLLCKPFFFVLFDCLLFFFFFAKYFYGIGLQLVPRKAYFAKKHILGKIFINFIKKKKIFSYFKNFTRNMFWGQICFSRYKM